MKLWACAAGSLLAVTLVVSCSKSAEWLKSNAYNMCQQFAEDQLRDPESTDWPSQPSSNTGPDASGVYKISVVATSKNGFGGTSRVSVSCTVNNNPAGSDTWNGSASVVGWQAGATHTSFHSRIGEQSSNTPCAISIAL